MNTPVRKRFDKKLFEEFDRSARDAARLHYTSLGYHVADHPNQYMQDLIASKDDSTFCVEVEVKRVWKSDIFPYETVQLPERKKKFTDTLTQFMIFNNSLSHAITFWSEQLLELEPVEVPNRYCYEGELFFQVPIKDCEIIKVNT